MLQCLVSRLELKDFTFAIYDRAAFFFISRKEIHETFMELLCSQKIVCDPV